MGIKSLAFGSIEIEKKNFFTAIRLLFFWKTLILKTVLVSKKISFGEKNYKYFIGYLHDNHKVKLLHIMLPKTRAYVKCYDRETKWMYFLIEDDDLLKKYNTIWDKVSADIKKSLIRSLSIIKNFCKPK